MSTPTYHKVDTHRPPPAPSKFTVTVIEVLCVGFVPDAAGNYKHWLVYAGLLIPFDLIDTYFYEDEKIYWGFSKFRMPEPSDPTNLEKSRAVVFKWKLEEPNAS